MTGSFLEDVLRGQRILPWGFVFLICMASIAMAQEDSPAPQSEVGAAPLRFEGSSPLILHAGAGSVFFTLVNPGANTATVSLRAGALTDDTSGTILPTGKVTFATDSGLALPPKLAPQGELRVQLTASNVSGSAVANAPIFNGDAQIGKLHVVDNDAPLDISVNGDGSSPDQRLVLTDGEDAVLTVKNNDAEAYPVDWVFQIGGKTVQSGELQLGPHGTSRIVLTPTPDLYTWTDAARPPSKTGILQLSLQGPAEVPKDILPQHTVQVNLLMRKLGAGWTSFWFHLFVILVLLLGGLLSVMSSSVLPIILRKIHLKRELNDIGERTSGVSTRVSSYLRTLLRLEHKRIELLLRRASFYSLSAVERLDEIATAMDRLKKRVKVAERLDDMRRKLEEIVMSAPPSMTDDIDNRLQMAAAQVESLSLTDEEVMAANSYMDKAAATLETLSTGEAMAQLIAANFKELRVRQKLFPYSYYNDLKTFLPGLFEMMNQPFDDPANITRPMMFAIDYGISALQLAFDYAVLRAGTPALEPGASPAAASARERLIAHHQEIVGLLGTLSWSALRELRALVQEMRENIYERDVLEEIATPGQAEILLQPQSVRPLVPILFSIRFKDSRFNDAAAIRRLTCKWDFPSHLVEQEWKSVHFFQGNEVKRGEPREISVAVRVESQKTTDAAPNASKESTKPLRAMLSKTLDLQRPERPSYSRAFAESVRFLIAFGVALAALLSGAMQQLDRLDFVPAMIAVLVLGFGADTVKNLLAQTARKASG